MSALTAAAEGMTCIRCGKGGGTVRACHYNGFRAHAYGKGRGIKASDLATAEFCDDCDRDFCESQYHQWPGGSKSVERSEEFLHYVLLTNIRRARCGVLTTHGGKACSTR